ncbi:hypothetical protein SAMN02745945_00976 [Peptoclostridium litorale DSM 5388]|uniref:DUF192 domain-containing protein n=1 Tax=Peptoclostridium litorale DSM 5388 TaxID=1121324 RepID=A0A069R9R9_PEPLI|nr:DUF192 domain-containing protein [Peptoclostridium litorale]KDR93781.1 hypothetical protein CLIT_23c00530 [Peptoclostridium litorale DSM 5388]SIN85737.1 hypothetical protein SAMN02745945_00976 [Peptoclostridium litorale DSM 5388]
MRLYNVSKECKIASKANMADSFFKRLRGLMGKRGLGKEECLIITPCNSIHTFFMKFPIDVIFVDGECKVVKLIRGIAPKKMVMPVKGAYFIVEFDSRNEMTCEIEEGDILKIEKM